jgi:hypothetical protein
VNFSAVQNDPIYFFLKSDLIPSSVSTTLRNFSGPLDDVITESDCILGFDQIQSTAHLIMYCGTEARTYEPQCA